MLISSERKQSARLSCCFSVRVAPLRKLLPSVTFQLYTDAPHSVECCAAQNGRLGSVTGANCDQDLVSRTFCALPVTITNIIVINIIIIVIITNIVIIQL